ncbi:MAG: ribulose-phosphate 3-epimerase [Candidatus Kerfeldbacteria bacterium]|nr:ribulose-phosphate 3-epimerase [Candidatus Kerfeldbacteria bacterium]
MATIIPGILTDSLAEAQRQLDRLVGLVEWAQIDFMDGLFVPAQSITAEEANTLMTDLKLEAHLMVRDPEAWATLLSPTLFRRVYFHVEALADPTELIRQLREAGFLIGCAVNLGTPLDRYREYVELVDNVLFMGVPSGAQGQAFDPRVIETIKAFILEFPDHQIGIDGGMTLQTIDQAANAGVDDIIVGSAISHSDNVSETIQALRSIIE